MWLIIPLHVAQNSPCPSGISHGGACGTWGEANTATRKARLYMVNFKGKSKESTSFRKEWTDRTMLNGN